MIGFETQKVEMHHKTEGHRVPPRDNIDDSFWELQCSVGTFPPARAVEQKCDKLCKSFPCMDHPRTCGVRARWKRMQVQPLLGPLGFDLRSSGPSHLSLPPNVCHLQTEVFPKCLRCDLSDISGHLSVQCLVMEALRQWLFSTTLDCKSS